MDGRRFGRESNAHLSRAERRLSNEDSRARSLDTALILIEQTGLVLSDPRVRHFVALVVVLLGAVAHDAQAVSSQDVLGGAISGYVIDSAGAPVDNALISASDSEGHPPRETVSRDDGSYEIRALPPGHYQLSTPSALVTREVDVREGVNLRADVLVRREGLSEVVVVSAAPPLLEWKRPARGVALAAGFLGDVAGSAMRTWSDFLLQVPGAVATQARFQTYGLYGTAPASGAVMVDGIDATSVLQGSTLYSQFAEATFADVAVVSGGKDMAMPLGLGPVTRIAAPSGGAQIAGSMTALVQPVEWNGTNTANGQDSTVKTAQVDGTIGGPLVPGRLWFFASARVARNGTGIPRSKQQLANLTTVIPDFRPFLNAWNGDAFFGKVTSGVGARHSIIVSATEDQFRLGGAQPNESGLFRDVVIGGPGVSGRVSTAWSRDLLTTVSWGYNAKVQENRNRPTDRPGVAIHQSTFANSGRLVGSGVVAVTDASTFAGLDVDGQLWAGGVDVVYTARGKASGHEIGVGLQLQPRRRDRRTSTYSRDGFQLEERVLLDRVTSVGAPPFHRQIYDASSLVTTFVDSSDAAVYLQDAWGPISGLTVTAGIRADVIRRRDRLFNLQTQRSTDLSRRVGATYAADRDAHLVIFASWGRNYDNLSVNEIQAGTNVTTVTDLYDTNLDGTFDAMFVSPAAQKRSTNVLVDLDHLHQPYVNELSGGLRRQLSGSASFEISGVRRKYGRPTAVETNANYAGNEFKGYRDETQNEIYRITENVWNWPVVTALDALVSTRGRRWSVLASISKQWNGLLGTWQPNDPAGRLQPDAFENRGGIGSVSGCVAGGFFCPESDGFSSLPGSGTWRAYVVHAAASYQAPWRLQTSINLTWQSGAWSGPVTQLASPDPAFGPATVTLSNGRVVSNPLATPVRFAYPTRAEGQLRLPSLVLANLRVGHVWRLGRTQLHTAVDILNLTNRDADQAFQIGATQRFSPLFGVSTSRQSPRSAMVSSRLSF